MSVADRIAALTPEQRELLELRRRRTAAAKAATSATSIRRAPGQEPIPRRGAGREWPLTFDQERLWFLYFLDPTATAYNIDTSTRMAGRLDAAALLAAVNAVVRRHEAWRTIFPAVDGTPVQVVLPELTLTPAEIDLRALPPPRREDLARTLQRQEARRPFDLERGPLVRVLLVRMGEADQICMITVHHIVTDWVSFQLFWRELAALYMAGISGSQLADGGLPPVPRQFADFAVWQRQTLSGTALDNLVAFWTAELAGVPQVLDLPFDRPRPPVQTTRGSEHPVEVSGRLAAALKSLAREVGATPFMAVMTAFKALLLRLTGQDQIVLGSPNANRNRKELEPLLGFFLTQLVFATDGSGDPTFRELLTRVRKSSLAAYSHQDLPFSKLLEALRPERDNSRPPLVQANFLLLDAEYTPMELPGLSIKPILLDDGNSRFDMTLGLWESAERIYGFFEYNLDLFDPATVARMAEAFGALVAAVVAEPGLRLSELPLLSAPARHQALVEWNDRGDLPVTGTVPALFARRATANPAAPAIVCGEVSLSYGELAARAAAVAEALAEKGIRNATREGGGNGIDRNGINRVGLLVERSADVPVGLLGIWGAGAAFVPLDPAYPAERLAFIARDAGLAAIVTRGHLLDRLPAATAATVLLEDLDGSISGAAAYAPPAAPSDLAYVLYTSGTTGQPKGVEVEHGALAGRLAATGGAFGWGPGDRILALAPFAFDIFLFELLNPLLAGGVCELPAAAGEGDRTALLDVEALLVSLRRATRVHAVPALLRQLLAAARDSPRPFPALRTVFTGGDAVAPELLAEVAEIFPGAGREVLYGPTEATIVATHATQRRDDPSADPTRPPLGRPFAGVELRLYDRHGALVPLGVAGEVYLGGVGVARGYLGRPEQTAARFVAIGGRRFYRTGDLARHRADGELEFLGRADDQVKVRGFRVEPGEVEAALALHPEVRESVVAAKPVRDGAVGADLRLVAYVVPREPWGVASPQRAEELRRFLRTLLPEHLVPAAVIPLESLPLTVHGKVDRKALPAPEAALASLAGEESAPRNAREELLAEIWRGVLGLAKVGIHDNFFQLGGDSILSIQVVARARRAGLALTPKQLFEHQTIAGLAALADLATATTVGTAIDQGPVEGEAPLTPVQHHYFAQAPAAPEHFTQAVLLAVREPLEPGRLTAAVARLLAHHDALRLRFLPDPAAPGDWRQRHAPIGDGGEAALLVVDLASLPAAQRRQALAAAGAQLQTGLDLAQGPLLTVALFRGRPDGGESDRLLLIAHHLVVDGVSWRILLEDLGAACRGWALPPKTTSWKSWAEGLVRAARAAAAGDELSWWLSRPYEGVRALPTEAAAAPGGESRAATVSATLPAATTAALLHEAPAAFRTQVNDLLLAALARTLARWTGGARVLVELEGHGREDDAVPGADTSRTVGWFTTLFPVLLEEGAAADPGRTIQAVKEGLRELPRHGLGFGLLRWLAGEGAAARLAALPLPQVAFNYLGQLDATLDSTGLFVPAPEETPEEIGGTEPAGGGRRHELEIDALVLGGSLEVRLTFDAGRLRREAVAALAESFVAELAAVVARCRELLVRGETGYTPSDFPLLREVGTKLDQAALDALRLGPGIEDLYPLAPLQEGMLFHGLYQQGSELYFEQLACRLQGPLDAGAFCRAWQQVVDRHPALRTAFLERGDGAPLQAVHLAARLPWELEDWRGLPAAEVERRWAERMAAERRRGFDLARPPLLRFLLARTGEEEHRLLWSFHHLLFDGWCFAPLFGEVFALYRGLRGGGEPALPPARPYRDYLAWLAGRKSDDTEWWRRALAGFAAATQLPFDRQETAGHSGGDRAEDYQERETTLAQPLAKALEGLAQRLRVTLNTVFQSAWAILLSRLGGERDVLFGTVASGRPADLLGVESIVGLFINALPVRVAVPAADSGVTLAAWLVGLQEAQAELHQHQWTPLARVQAASDLPPGQPLFHSLMVFENYPVDPALGEGVAGIAIRDVAISERTNYPLTLTVVARGGTTLRLTFDRRFDPATASRLLGQLATLLAAMAANPKTAPARLPLLAEAERHQAACEWNDTAAEYPSGAALHALFGGQAARRPSAPALRTVDGEVSYGELARRASALAAELARRGVGRGDVVGVCAERSVELVSALLGILQAGAAYLPLDPAYPRERLEWMLADAGDPWVLVAPHLAALLPGGCRTLALAPIATDATAAIGAPGPAPALLPVGGGDLAYVLYTSGSTGRPKGVAVPHRAVARLVRGNCASFGPDEVFLMLAPVSFDASTLEIWGPLANGGCLSIPPFGEVTLDALETAVRELGVTTLWLTAGLFHLVVDERPAALAPLTQLLAGGDVLSPAHVARLRRALPGLRLINGYGPTEGTTFTTCHAVAGIPAEDAGSVPIGRPIANTQALVLDRELEPVPVGVAGELYAGGAGLAFGYLGRPDLTAASFVPAPPCAGLAGLSPGERLYRTGDRVRRLADGSLDFLGRGDRQVKLRGFRVEPGEIEAALTAHPAVREAVVVVAHPGGQPSGEDARERRLVAWLAGDGPAAAAGVLAHLAARLPAHMIPAELRWLDALPLGPTGKVDRAALEARTAAAAQPAADAPAEKGFVAPRNEVEERLAACWRAVLRRERLGVHDDFFHLGGDSILSIQLVARLRQAGLAVTPRQIFEAPTIAALALLAGSLAPAAAGDAAAEQGQVTGEVPLTPVQHWFFAGRPAAPHHFNQSLLLVPRIPHAERPLAAALAALAAHHDALRLRFTAARFTPVEDGWQQRCAESRGELDAPLHTVDLGALPAGRRAGAVTAAAALAQGAFDLARGPLLRAVRFAPGAGEPERLLLVAHHLVVDGVSWRILLEDLETAYERLSAGRPAGLPAKTTSFKRWAERLVERAAAADARRELARWLAAPADVEPLPRDFGAGLTAAPALATTAAATVLLPREASQFLLGAAPAVYRAGVEDLLLAALARAFARWTGPATGETRLRLDLEGHGREELEPGIDLSRTVGWFTAIYPLVLEGAEAASPRDAIRAAKETLRGVPHRGLGYGLLRWFGEGTETLAARPDPEVSFNYLGQLDGMLGDAAPFAPAPEPAGPEQSAQERLRHAIEINAWVLDGELQASFAYSCEHYAPATIERLAAGFLTALGELLAHCAGAEAGGYSPSDFPLAGLERIDQRTLDAVFGTGAALDRTVEDVYPLAPLQGGMLFQSLYAPAAELYFEHLTCALEGPLDGAAFARAWQGVVDRHPALRTGFLWTGVAQPLQVVRRGLELPWVEEDWRHVEREELPRRLAAWLAADRARGFDLARSPLTRAALLRTGEAEHRFVWSFHHLLIDGWCFSPLLREVLALYRAEIAGDALRLPAVRPYREFIAWVERQDRAAAAGYFRRLLAGFTAPTPVPVDRLGPGGGEIAADDSPREQELRLSASLAAALSALARRRGLTLNTLVQGAWAVLLSRFSGQRDVVFGTVVSGRPAELPGVESMVGLFINTLPARFRVEPGALLAEWLAGVQARLLELRQHETVALAEVQRASEVPAGEPLFASLVAFENYPVDESLGEGAAELAALKITAVDVVDRADYPLSAAAMPARGGRSLELRLAHDGSTDPATARRLLGHWAALLAGFAAAPEGTLDGVSLLTAAERHQLLAEWSDTREAPAPPAECLHRLVETRALLAPGAPAVLGDAEALSYGELDRRANLLAHHLRALGVGPEERVLLWVRRSPAMVVAILGVLKAGGAYAPVDPKVPPQRIAVLRADLARGGGSPAEPILLTDAALAASLPPALGEGTRVVVLEAAEAAAGRGEGATFSRGVEPPAGGAGPHNLAYVLYTSGSTGEPKGVAVEHRSIAAYVRSTAADYGLGPGDRMLHFSSLSFDISLEELFCPLARGAAVVVDAGEAEEPARFLARCRDRGITMLSLPTAYWHQLAQAVDPDLQHPALPLPPALRLMVIGGERALPERWTAWRRAVRRGGERVRTINSYGPTETTVAAVMQDRREPLARGRREVPIGRPMAGVEARALADGVDLVPLGGLGELVLGGPGVARGYHMRPEATAAAFVPDPFAATPGARAYRSGDLVHRLPDGMLEFAGRVDAQVKVRGYRIELGEVEAALAAHPQIRDAAAVAPEDASGNRLLVAYVVPLVMDGGEGDLARSLREALGKRLPPYMVPSIFVPLPALPLTTSGKVDRRALEGLPLPRELRGEAEWVPPRNAVEVELAAIWGDLLGVERVGAGDDFFALGGHSLLATQLASRLDRSFGVQVPLARLFELRRLADLGEEILRLRLAATDGEPGSAIDRALAELDHLSDDEALALLALEEENEGSGAVEARE